jgi:hypothetical protein
MLLRPQFTRDVVKYAGEEALCQLRLPGRGHKPKSCLMMERPPLFQWLKFYLLWSGLPCFSLSIFTPFGIAALPQANVAVPTAFSVCVAFLDILDQSLHSA